VKICCKIAFFKSSKVESVKSKSVYLCVGVGHHRLFQIDSDIYELHLECDNYIYML